jgi:hypothetical protein
LDANIVVVVVVVLVVVGAKVVVVVVVLVVVVGHGIEAQSTYAMFSDMLVTATPVVVPNI